MVNLFTCALYFLCVFLCLRTCPRIQARKSSVGGRAPLMGVFPPFADQVIACTLLRKYAPWLFVRCCFGTCRWSKTKKRWLLPEEMVALMGIPTCQRQAQMALTPCLDMSMMSSNSQAGSVPFLKNVVFYQIICYSLFLLWFWRCQLQEMEWMCHQLGLSNLRQSWHGS